MMWTTLGSPFSVLLPGIEEKDARCSQRVEEQKAKQDIEEKSKDKMGRTVTDACLLPDCSLYTVCIDGKAKSVPQEENPCKSYIQTRQW